MHQELLKRGVRSVNCVSVNDSFVMQAWGDVHKAGGKVHMLADPAGEFVKAMDLTINVGFLGGLRSTRFAMVIEDGKVKSLEVEKDPTVGTCSLAGSIIKKL
jgi:2-Cys peroxiredoxin 5